MALAKKRDGTQTSFQRKICKYSGISIIVKKAQQNLLSMNELISSSLFNLSSYEYSANLFGEVFDQAGKNIIQKGDLLIAYSGNQPRGVSESCFIPDLNRYIFTLTVFFNSDHENLNFRIKSLACGKEIPLSEELIFSIDAVFGKVLEPYPLSIGKSSPPMEAISRNAIIIHPNPVNDKLHIKSESKIFTIILSDVSKNCIQTVTNIYKSSFLLNTQNLNTGVYFLKIETANGIIVRKLIKSAL